MTSRPLMRQARLRPEFADLYPPIEPAEWMSAAELGAMLLRWVTSAGATVTLGPRLLPEEHFEFRGGALPRGSIASPRTRRDDAPSEGERAAG